MSKMSVFSGTASRALTAAICDHLSIPPGRVIIEPHNDGEIFVKYLDEVRDRDVFIVNTTPPPAENILELCLLAYAARQASAHRITFVIPYFGYDRQDRKDEPRVALSAKVIARMLSPDINRVLLLDLHSEPTEGFFSDNVISSHLYTSPQFIPYLKGIVGANFVVASADVGGIKRARKYAHLLGTEEIVVFDKSRPAAGQLDKKKMKIIGDVDGRDVLFVDDMVDTAGTFCDDAEAARAKGARRIWACATHPLFSSRALELLDASPIEELIISDTIPIDPERLKNRRIKITVCSVAPLLAKAIRSLNDGSSLSALIPK